MAKQPIIVGIDKTLSNGTSDETFVTSQTQTNLDEKRTRSEIAEGFKKRLKMCLRGKKTAKYDYPSIFEDICFDIVKTIFAEEFDKVHCSSQLVSVEADGNVTQRRDIVLAITSQKKSKENYGAWTDYFKNFNSSHVVFECKNYEVPISEHEVFQVFMYEGSSCRMGFIFTRRSCNKYKIECAEPVFTNRAKSAIKRLHSIKDESWMIMIFGDKEIFKMLDAYVAGNLLDFFVDEKLQFELVFGS